MKKALLAVCLICVSMGGCITVPQGQYIGGSPTDYEFEIEAPRSQVFGKSSPRPVSTTHAVLR